MAGRKLLLKNTKAVKRESNKADMPDVVDKLLRMGSEKFKRELMKLQGKEYVDRYLQMLEYSVPKLSRVDKNASDDFKPINVQFITSNSAGAMEQIKAITPKEEVIDISLVEVEEE